MGDVNNQMKTDTKPIISAYGSNILACGLKETTGGYAAEGQYMYHYSIENDKLILNKDEKDDSGEVIRSAPRANKSVSGVAYSNDGSKVAIGDEKNLRIYNVVDGFNEPAIEMHGHLQSINCMEWSPCSRYLCTGGVDQRLYVWDTENPKKNACIVGGHPKSVVMDVAWLDQNTIISVGEDFCINQWTVTF